MEDYKPNSNKYKEELKRKKAEKIVTGNVKLQEKGGIRKLFDLFVQGDADDIKSNILMDVLIPQVKKTISDIIDIVMYGNPRTNVKTTSGRTPYGGFFMNRPNSNVSARTPRNVYDYNKVLIDNRGEAELILSELQDRIDDYGIASVADFYELAGVEGSFVDNKYGWTDIRSAEIIRSRDGYYLINLPKALPID